MFKNNQTWFLNVLWYSLKVMLTALFSNSTLVNKQLYDLLPYQSESPSALNPVWIASKQSAFDKEKPSSWENNIKK